MGYQALHSFISGPTGFEPLSLPILSPAIKNGKSYSVRYNEVNAMLLNEFLKEHATVQNLKKNLQL